MYPFPVNTSKVFRWLALRAYFIETNGLDKFNIVTEQSVINRLAGFEIKTERI